MEKMSVEDITKLVSGQMYSKCAKLIKRSGGNNIRLYSNGESLECWIMADKTRVSSFEFQNILLSPLEYKMAKLFGKGLSNSVAVLVNYLAFGGRDYVLVPMKVEKKVQIYEVLENKYKKIELEEIIKAAYV